MKRPNISGSIPAIVLVWDLYIVTRGELWDLRSEVLDYLENHGPLTSRITNYRFLTVDEVRNMKGLLHYRNWLAHGRWWVAKLGTVPVVGNVKSSVENLLHCLKIPFS